MSSDLLHAVLAGDGGAESKLSMRCFVSTALDGIVAVGQHVKTSSDYAIRCHAFAALLFLSHELLSSSLIVAVTEYIVSAGPR